MKKPLLFFLFISLNVFGQGEISKFEFETSYSIAPVASFSYNKNHYIISNYYDTNSSTLKIYALHLLKFDHNYKYISRQRIKFKKFSLNNIIIKSLKEIKPSVYNIVFFNKTPTSYECISSIFNLNSLEITNYKIKYIISFSEIVNPKFFKIISDNEKTYFLNLQPKQKVLTIYSLFENSYAKKSITLENDFLKNMKLSIGSLKNGREANNYLDTPIRTQYYVKDNYLYLINGHCLQGSKCVQEIVKSPINIIKINLKTGELIKKKVLGNIPLSLFSTKVGTAFTIVNNKLFYTYGTTSDIFINALDLDNFTEKSITLNVHYFNNLGLTAQYAVYNKNPKKVKKEKINFKKFIRKFYRNPSLAVKQVNDSIYDFKLGNIMYKTNTSFDSFLVNTALAYVSYGISNSISNLTFSYHYPGAAYSNKGNPMIYKTEFSLNLFNKSISNGNKEEMSPKHSYYLNHFDYFFKKQLVSPMLINQKEISFIYLFRSKSNWGSFYIYNFEK